MTPDAAVVAMQQVAQAMRKLARVPSRVAPLTAPRLEQLLREQFAREENPYGRRWKPLSPVTVALKARHGGRPEILQDSGRMLDELAVEPLAGAGLAVTLGAPYSAFAQVGTRNAPARPIMPTAALPSGWNAALRGATEEAFAEATRGT